MDAQHQVLNFGITLISRVLMLRDRLLGRVASPLPMDAAISVSRHTIPSGRNRIDAVFVTPDAKNLKANLLLCHGIGETVEHWFIVQQLLASCGVATLRLRPQHWALHRAPGRAGCNLRFSLPA